VSINKTTKKVMNVPYPNLSLVFKKDISETTVETLKLISKLDESSEKLSGFLDEKLEAISGVEDLTNRQKEVKEINIIRKTIEAIASKKLDLAVKCYDLIDVNVKAIDVEMNGIEKSLLSSGVVIPPSSFVNGVKDSSNALVDESIIGAKRKRDEGGTKEDAFLASASSLTDATKQSNDTEPIYCICKKVAYGEMVACDNEDCPIEWFHYPCVNLSRKPKNSWICPLCSADKKKK
jgi:inhibitor of growth protein 5